MTEQQQLSTMDGLVPVSIFRKDVDTIKILNKIRSEAMSVVFDVKKTSDRKAMRSLAAKVSKSKTAMDIAGKGLTQEWKEKSKLVDESRKIMREFMDQLRDDIKAPAVEYDKNKAAEEAEKKLADDKKADHIEAIRLNEQYDKTAEIQAREQAIAEREAQAEAEIQAAQAELKRLADLEQARIDAVKHAEEKADRLERQRLYDENKAKQLAQENEEKSKRLIEKAEYDKKQALINAENARLENDRVEREAKAKKAANFEHRRGINNAALAELNKIIGNIEISKKVIVAISNNTIPNITVNY